MFSNTISTLFRVPFRLLLLKTILWFFSSALVISTTAVLAVRSAVRCAARNVALPAAATSLQPVITIAAVASSSTSIAATAVKAVDVEAVDVVVDVEDVVTEADLEVDSGADSADLAVSDASECKYSLF